MVLMQIIGDIFGRSPGDDSVSNYRARASTIRSNELVL